MLTTADVPAQALVNNRRLLGNDPNGSFIQPLMAGNNLFVAGAICRNNGADSTEMIAALTDGTVFSGWQQACRDNAIKDNLRLCRNC